MGVELLGHAGGKPRVELLVAPGGERFPLSLPIDDSYAFDHGLARRGWVAVQVGQQVAAICDGDLFHPRRLPDAWSVLPAADPGLALVTRYFGRSREEGEPTVIELVDAYGTVLRSVSAQVWGAVGELRSGLLVSRDGFVSWDGEVSPPPGDGLPEAVVGGRYVVMFDAQPHRMRLLDIEAGSTAASALLPDDFWVLTPSYDPDASMVAFAGWDYRGVVVAGAEAGVHAFDLSFEPHSVVWTGDGELLAVGDSDRCVIDVRSSSQSKLEGLPRGAYPRLDVTGRFDLEQLREAARPPWVGAVPDALRAELVERSAERIRVAAADAGLESDLLAQALPAIRIRSCVPPKRFAAGASRLGGRPDLPAGFPWPEHRGSPMAFLAQLRCAELSAALPERGLRSEGVLLVFAAVDPDNGNADAGHVEVVSEQGLKRRPWPAALSEELRYSTSLAVAEPIVSHPDWSVLRQDSDEAAVARFCELTRMAGPEHRLFGHPTTIQGGRPPEGHSLLLQFDEDALLDASFADGGRLHFWWPDGASLDGVVACRVEMECY